MLEGTARARVSRALNTRSTTPAERYNFQVGEEVDFYRKPGAKDASGWYGPAVVHDISNAARSVIQIKWQGQIMEVELRNVRVHATLFVYFQGAVNPRYRQLSTAEQAWEHLRSAISALTRGTCLHLGYIHDGSSWRWSKTTARYASILAAARIIAATQLQLMYVVGIRVLHACRCAQSITGAEAVDMLVWTTDQQYPSTIELRAIDGRYPVIGLTRNLRTRTSGRISVVFNSCQHMKYILMNAIAKKFKHRDLINHRKLLWKLLTKIVRKMQSQLKLLLHTSRTTTTSCSSF